MFNEWNVVLTIVTLIVPISAFIRISMSYQKSITKLTVTLDNLQATIVKIDDSLIKHKDKVDDRFVKNETAIAEHHTHLQLLEERTRNLV